jgi:hypothetical protein
VWNGQRQDSEWTKLGEEGFVAVSEADERRSQQSGEPESRMIYGGDPLARLLIDRLGLNEFEMALAAVGWSAIYLFVLPTIFGSLHSRGEYLGSLDDWHAQILLLLILPATCMFYVWQPRAIAGVYRAMVPGGQPLHGGRMYRSKVWLFLSLAMAVAIVGFDGPKMAATYGSWWMPHNWLTILGREAGLAVAFYILSSMTWRQFVATWEWRQLLASPFSTHGLRAVSTYGLSWSMLLALLALRLSIEAIELPERAGTITPDYYAKVAAYVVASVSFFWAPMWGAFGRDTDISSRQLMMWLELAGILALPLLGFLVLKLLLGP